MNVEEIPVWCAKCEKTVRLLFIRVTDEKWIAVNLHEHALPLSICPRSLWLCADYKDKVYGGSTE